MSSPATNNNSMPNLRLATPRNHSSAAYSNSDTATDALAHMSSPGGVKDMALLHATRAGDLDAVTTLLAEGANVNATDTDDWTPLMLAIVKGHPEVTLALLDGGANVHARNCKGWTALRFAVSMDDAEALTLLLDWGANVNDQDDEGDTALMQAAREKSIESLKILLANGAKKEIRNHAGEKALKIAARHGHPEIIQWLEQGTGNETSTADLTDSSGLFSEGELDQLMERIEGLIPGAAPVLRPSIVRSEEQSLAPAGPPPSVVERLVNALEALRTGIQPATPSMSITDIAHKLLLGLPEAAALSGLSRNRLREAIRDGSLEGRKIGRKWMIKRSALQSYVKKL